MLIDIPAPNLFMPSVALIPKTKPQIIIMGDDGISVSKSNKMVWKESVLLFV